MMSQTCAPSHGISHSVLVTLTLALSITFAHVTAVQGIVDESGASVKIVPSTNQIKPLGSSLILTCSLSFDLEVDGASDRPAHRGRGLVWKGSDGKEIAGLKGRRYVEWLDDERLRLYVTSLTSEDEGEFKCIWSSAPTSRNALVIPPPSAQVNVSLFEDINFEDGPEQYSVTAGSTVLLKCVARGRPAPEVSWRFRGNKIATDTGAGHKQYRRESGTEQGRGRVLERREGLEIKEVGPEDEGLYQCRALVSSQGNLRVRNVKLTVLHLPVSLGPLVADEAVTGQDFSVTCKSAGQPGVTFEWLKDGMLQKPRKLLLDEVSTIIIKGISTNKSIDNPTDQLDRKDHADQSDFTDYLESIETLENIQPNQNDGNTRAWLTDAVTGNKAVEVGVGVTLSDEDSVDQIKLRKQVINVLSRDGGSVQTSRLIVRGAQSTRDNGRYSCRMSNELGSRDASINIRILEAPRLDSQIKVSPLRAVEGRNIELHCEIVAGFPSPRLYWTRPSGEIVRNRLDEFQYEDRVELDESRQGESKLIVHSIVRGDSGNYSCAANNSVGYYVKTFTVVVEYKPDITWHGQLSLDSSDDDQQSATSTGTNLLNEVWEVEGWEGQRRILRCESRGQPVPKFNWKHRDHYIQESRDGTLGSNNSRLKSSMTQTNDSLLKAASQSMNTENTNDGFWEKDPAEPQSVSDSNHLSPDEQTYKINTIRIGEKTVSSLEIYIAKPGNGKKSAQSVDTSVVKKTSVDEEDVFGEYSCMAKNSHGGKAATFNLIRAVPPSAPRNITLDSLTSSSLSLTLDHYTGPGHTESGRDMKTERQNEQDKRTEREKKQDERRTTGNDQDPDLDYGENEEHYKDYAEMAVKHLEKEEQYLKEENELSEEVEKVLEKERELYIAMRSPPVQQWVIEAHNLRSGTFFVKTFPHQQMESEDELNVEQENLAQERVALVMDGLEADTTYVLQIYAENVVGKGSVAKIQLKTPVIVEELLHDANIQSDAAAIDEEGIKSHPNQYLLREGALEKGKHDGSTWSKSWIMMSAIAGAALLVLLLVSASIGATVWRSRNPSLPSIDKTGGGRGVSRGAGITPTPGGSSATLLIRGDGKDIDSLKIDVSRVGGVSPLPEELYRSLGRKPKINTSMASPVPVRNNNGGDVERGNVARDGLFVQIGSEAQRKAWQQMIQEVKVDDVKEEESEKPTEEERKREAERYRETGECREWGIVQRENDVIDDQPIRESGEYGITVSDDDVSMKSDAGTNQTFEGKSFLSRL